MEATAAQFADFTDLELELESAPEPTRKSKARAKDADGSKPSRMPRDASPQLAVLATEPPQGNQWVEKSWSTPRSLVAKSNHQ